MIRTIASRNFCWCDMMWQPSGSLVGFDPTCLGSVLGIDPQGKSLFTFLHRWWGTKLVKRAISCLDSPASTTAIDKLCIGHINRISEMVQDFFHRQYIPSGSAWINMDQLSNCQQLITWQFLIVEKQDQHGSSIRKSQLGNSPSIRLSVDLEHVVSRTGWSVFHDRARAQSSSVAHCHS